VNEDSTRIGLENTLAHTGGVGGGKKSEIREKDKKKREGEGTFLRVFFLLKCPLRVN